MNVQDLHTHSVWDDGQDSLEDMANAAVSAGLSAIGFSVHVPIPFPNDWTIPADRLDAFRAEARRLRAAFAERVDVYCGAEWDPLSFVPPTGFDYVIGSVHHVMTNGTAYSVDASPERTDACIREAFGGSADAMARAYFRQLPALADIPEIDVIGHFDLPTKFDETHGFFSAGGAAFASAALEAMEPLVAAEKLFEINTGAISRGYRTTPYPSRALLSALRRMGGRIAIHSDAHCARHVAFGFRMAERLALSCGFAEVWRFDGKTFAPERIDPDQT